MTLVIKKTILLSLLGICASVLVSACATDDRPPQRESSIPWNRPQEWEGGGNVPGFANSL